MNTIEINPDKISNTTREAIKLAAEYESVMTRVDKFTTMNGGHYGKPTEKLRDIIALGMIESTKE